MANNSAIAFWAAQANDLSGGAHPTGWVSGQRWHVTSDQWQAMYSASNASAFDPENQVYSFPGHAPNTVLWSQSAQYWKGQADFFFGPNRVVNSGSSWEALYNAEVGLYNNEVAAYNDMVNQRNSYINAYNATIPLAYTEITGSCSGTSNSTCNLTGAGGGGIVTGDGHQLTITKQGQYVFWVEAAIDFEGSTGSGSARINLNIGGVNPQTGQSSGQNGGFPTIVTAYFAGALNNTQIISMVINSDFHNHNVQGGQWHLIFVPIPTIPH